MGVAMTTECKRMERINVSSALDTFSPFRQFVAAPFNTTLRSVFAGHFACLLINEQDSFVVIASPSLTSRLI
jgi:hypothetical protein